MSNAQKLNTREILERNLSRVSPDGMRQLKIVLHNVRSMHNVGSVFRSADAFGISDLLISGYTPSPPRPEISKTAIGAEKFVAWETTEDPIPYLKRYRLDGYSIIAIEQTHNSTPLPYVALPPGKKICLLFGNEVTGIEDELLAEADVCVEIPQYGKKHSLNISVAAGITLYGFLQKYLQP